MISPVARPETLWVFEKPLRRDWLFVVAMVLAVVGIGRVVARHDSYGWLGLCVSIAATLPSALLLVGVTAGSVREYRHARRHD
jgi:hypothetical protein